MFNQEERYTLHLFAINQDQSVHSNSETQIVSLLSIPGIWQLTLHSHSISFNDLIDKNLIILININHF